MGDLLLSATRHVCLMLSLYMLPFVVYACGSKRVGAVSAALYLVAYAGVVTGVGVTAGVAPLGWIAVGYAYYASVAACVYWVPARVWAEKISRGATFALLAFAFLLLPGMLWPGEARLYFLVAGWGLTLSSYSYCVETSRPGSPPKSWRDGLFFLLVNPTLLYTQRGERISGETAPSRGVLRAVGGACLLLVNSATLQPAVRELSVHAAAWPSIPALGVPVLYGSVRLIAEYASHSALASIQIGAMRTVGWRVPERYCYPLLATSPMDFWRRWNTYVRVWLEAYVFLPTGTWMARRTRNRGAQLAAVVIALAASGLLHDLYVLAARQTVSYRFTAFFLAAGAVMALWRLAETRGGSGTSDPHTQRSFVLPMRAIATRACVITMLIGFAWSWG